MTLESKTLNSLKSFVEIALKSSSSTTVSDSLIGILASSVLGASFQEKINNKSKSGRYLVMVRVFYKNTKKT